MKRTMSFAIGDGVRVEWNDPMSYAGWRDMAVAAQWEPAACISLGWVVGNTDAALTIAGTKMADMSQVGELSAIPWGCITSLTGL